MSAEPITTSLEWYRPCDSLPDPGRVLVVSYRDDPKGSGFVGKLLSLSGDDLMGVEFWAYLDDALPKKEEGK